MRTRAAASEITAEEANMQYADTLSHLVEHHLGTQKSEVAENLERELGIALYQFRNPNNTFRKQDNDINNEDDDEDF